MRGRVSEEESAGRPAIWTEGRTEDASPAFSRERADRRARPAGSLRQELSRADHGEPRENGLPLAECGDRHVGGKEHCPPSVGAGQGKTGASAAQYLRD